MKRLGTLDASWLAVESEDTPMHVGTLQIFALPEGAPETFLRDLVNRMKEAGDVAPPWGYKLAWSGFLGRLIAPAWKIDKDIDLDYHVRHSALPRPGGERELGILVSRLHSNPLDFSRPLWECHVIEGLENNRFALYTKMHHSMIDGISGVRLMQRVLTTDPDRVNMPPPWTVRPERRRGSKTDKEASVPAAFSQAMDALKLQADMAPRLWQAGNRLVHSVRHPEDGLTAPFTGPVSILNHRVTGQRRFATQHYQLDRLKALAQASGGSLNDIVLYLCGTALRRFLLEQDSVPAIPLTAGIPVNIRPADDEGTGTQISFMIASLATNEADPLAADQGFYPPGQGTPAKTAEECTDPVHHAADVALYSAADVGSWRPHAAGVQRHHLECTGAGKHPVLRGSQARGHVPGLADCPRRRPQHHLPELCRLAELRVHRLPGHPAEHAEAGGVHRRGTG